MIKKISLENFRNFEKNSFEFGEGVNLIIGENASGKTNLLEAIYLLSTGKSFKARKEDETVNYSADLTRIVGVSSIKNAALSIKDSDGSMIRDTKYVLHDTKLEIILTRGTNGWPRKRLLINGVGKRLVDFAGNLKTVLFGPWDMDLVTESPSIRRRFLDNVLSLTDREYRRSILSYEKGLRQRNRLLHRIREEGIHRSQLMFWDNLLIKNGDYINRCRHEFIEFVNTGNFQFPIFPPAPSLRRAGNFQLSYDPSTISEARLKQYEQEEVAAGMTLVGPHRDDFVFKISNNESRNTNLRELSRYGSRGEQRMGILWLKIAELSYVESATGGKPVLLLDDIFSELDHEHRDIVMEFIGKQQTIITTADPHYVEGIKGGYTIKIPNSNIK